ncbi:hypothetical protein RINTHH_18480 [Richelia intracellularis HH01]|uniref:Uncharacterized protein n=1 Tax=Richelia intracellularis HH01 TaxID=1165094 RepID=M1X190_9NOST|nr:hypothetical protein RINTHH_18480 [Richelia intracellularis HH01]
MLTETMANIKTFNKVGSAVTHKLSSISKITNMKPNTQTWETRIPRII